MTADVGPRPSTDCRNCGTTARDCNDIQRSKGWAGGCCVWCDEQGRIAAHTPGTATP